jgi:phage terminase small subunit
MSVLNGQQDLFIESPIWWEGLTGPRRKFVEYYCTDSVCFLNATQAYIKAFSKPGKQLSDSSIQSNASRMMRDQKIKTAVVKLLRTRQGETDFHTEYRLLKSLQTLALYDTADIVDKNGRLKKDLSELGELSVCITGIKQGKYGTEIKLYDRTRALELLMRYLELVRPADSVIAINPNIYLSEKDIEQQRIAELNALPAGEYPAAEAAEYAVVEA